ncbi:Autotransporter-associated beta strand repeat protein [Botrimarina colliarenosi]|uniref:Autotransporter-associated beta strand repeat protein n=1 Tax=Botrimarina colliarenosi TaxID=2528001 RepID=A0A5C5ZXG2_9BACT|nr:autotransporter-associated beta strand repeat-containing protein [Botrimarina colliarenosi]TWT92324.1 Autotransporter-associated beta strand repeat protein [Botrimarina colliarenosi]
MGFSCADNGGGLRVARTRRLFLLLGVSVLATPAPGALTFTVGGSWPNAAHQAAAEAAMQAVVARYNAYSPTGFDNRDVYVYYNAGIPTAQASYGGSIGFGGTYPNERVTAHELAHYLGLPSSQWGNVMSGGTWTGALGLAKVKQFDGEQATINGDGVHFWPYGLNYDNEGSEVNKQRQVAIVYAMRGDLGIGSTTHPSTLSSRVTVAQTADDPVGQSGFNYMGRWSDGYFAHPGYRYTTADYKLRTPASSNAYKFYGDSLTVENTNGALGGLYYSGQGGGALVTIPDLLLDGGWVQHRSGLGSPFQLDGAVSVESDSVLYAKQGDIDLLASVSGSGAITIPVSDSPTQNARYVRFKSSSNTFVGDVVNQSRFELAEGANFRFAIGPAGATNAITGSTARATALNGVFDLDLSQATSSPSDSWTLVTAANTSYGSGFQVAGFEGYAGTWSDGAYSFNQATGALTTVNAWGVDGGGAWSNAGSWTAGVPNAGGEATFGPALGAANAPATVAIDTPVMMSRINFNNANAYKLSGAQPITLSGAALVVAMNGSHEIAAPVAGVDGLRLRGGGVVALSAANTYSGDTQIDAGTLKLVGSGTLGAGDVQVGTGATLDVSGLSSPLQLASGQTLNMLSGSNVAGEVAAGAGSAIVGSGVFSGGVVVRSGGTLRVGAEALPIVAQASLIDNFNSYTIGNVGAHSSGDATGGVWDGVFDGTANGQIVGAGRGNLALMAVGVPSQGNGGWRGAATDLANAFAADQSLADGDTATYFLQVKNEGNAYTDTVFGLTGGLANVGINNAWQDYSVMPSIVGSPGAAALRLNGTDLVTLTDGEWQNVWLVVDNGAKTIDIYTSTGADGGVLAASDVGFGQITDPDDLAAFAITGREDGRVQVDNLYRIAGEYTGNPLAPGGGVLYGTEVLAVAGDVDLEAGAKVSLGIGTAGASDRLDVGGRLTAGGILEVQLADGAPGLVAGDSYDLFDFTEASGAFDAYGLPALGANLSWDLANLMVDGTIAVVAGQAGDFNNDGFVNAADYTVWRDGLGGAYTEGDYDTWRANYGASSAAVAVPEPASLLLAILLAGAASQGFRRA